MYQNVKTPFAITSLHTLHAKGVFTFFNPLRIEFAKNGDRMALLNKF